MHLGNRDPRPNEILELGVTVPMHILICIYVPALCPQSLFVRLDKENSTSEGSPPKHPVTNGKHNNPQSALTEHRGCR
jgi:hypothetical protein